METGSAPPAHRRKTELDAFVFIRDAGAATDSARGTQAAAFDGWFAGEAGYDPFVACAAAALSTSTVRIGTNVAIAFGRTPMTVAYAANDLQALSAGRFVLGLGSQIEPHITRRYSMPWSKPAARMREFVTALQAIWAAWEHGTKLDFRGDFYQHTLMSPFFVGHQHGFGRPPVGLAAVGPMMTRVAGEVADLFLAHVFSTEKYLRTESLKQLEAGLHDARRAPDEVSVVVNTFVVTGRTDEERTQVDQATRRQLAFYASTPAYRRVLELHGWADLQTDLHRLAREDRWADMAGLIDDNVLDAFAVVVDDPEDAGPAIARRYGDIADRICLYPTWQPDMAAVIAIRDALDLTARVT
jgi:probable F420-dependent oxidoreductase